MARKWNNQGGSSRDGGRKNKINKPSDPFDIPSFEDLKESEITSFRIVKQRQQRPDYGEFKDAVWVPDVIIDDDLIRDLEDPYRFPDGSTDRIDEIKPFSKTDNIKKVPLPNPNKDLTTIFRSEDLFPHSAKDEYELIVKFKKVILTILSGQAYAARNQLNDKKYDSSIVILSDKPIAMSGIPKDVNIIKLVNGVQDPIDSLYHWMMTKAKIVTDGTGKNADVKLLSIRRQQAGKRLPETSFTYNGKQYGLFYVSSGIQPYQICMHARNDVVKFAAGNPRDDKYWSVLNANPPLSLCIANIPTISIALAPGSASELRAGSGMSFVLRVTVDPIQSGDTLVEYEISGTADPNFYTVTGTSFDSDGIPVVNIPNINNKTVSIEPLSNPSQTQNKTIVFKLLEKDSRYLIDEDLVDITVTVLPNIPSYIHTRYCYKDVFRTLYYKLSSTPVWYRYASATQNGGFNIELVPNPDMFGISTPRNIKRVADSFAFTEFSQRIITSIYTKQTNSTTTPIWTPADQSNTLDPLIYRYLTGNTTLPDGTPASSGYVPPVTLMPNSALNGFANVPDSPEMNQYPADPVVGGRSTSWLYAFRTNGGALVTDPNNINAPTFFYNTYQIV